MIRFLFVNIAHFLKIFEEIIFFVRTVILFFLHVAVEETLNIDEADPMNSRQSTSSNANRNANFFTLYLSIYVCIKVGIIV